MQKYWQKQFHTKSRRIPAKILDSQQKRQSSGGSQTGTVLGSPIRPQKHTVKSLERKQTAIRIQSGHWLGQSKNIYLQFSYATRNDRTYSYKQEKCNPNSFAATVWIKSLHMKISLQKLEKKYCSKISKVQVYIKVCNLIFGYASMDFK